MIKLVLYISSICISYLEKKIAGLEEDNNYKEILIKRREELVENMTRIKTLINE